MKLEDVKKTVESLSKKKMNWNEETTLPQVFLDISNIWKELDKDERQLLSKKIFRNEIIDKKYIGTDLKWLLYTYVVDFQKEYNTENLTFICGKFVYNKLCKLSDFKVEGKYNDEGRLNLNGENIKIYCYPILNKMELILCEGILQEWDVKDYSKFNNEIFYFA